jgi:hypothetical protein
LSSSIVRLVPRVNPGMTVGDMLSKAALIHPR